MEIDRSAKLTVLLLGALIFLGSSFTTIEVFADESFTRDSVDRYNKYGVELSSRPWWRRHPLIDAALIGDVRLARWLLDQDVDVNATNRSGFTALMAAAYRGHLDVTKLLLATGADRDQKDESGYTALHLACRVRNHEIVKALQTRRGQDKLGENGTTQECPETDDSPNARPGRRDQVSRGGTPTDSDHRLDSSVRFTDAHRLEIDRLDLYGCPLIHEFDNRGRTPLMKAAGRGDLERVTQLLAEGANIEEQKDRAGTALIAAAENGHAKVVKYLLTMGADINAGTDYRGTPMTAAACGAQSEIMRLLIEHGANVNEARPLGHSGAKYEWLPLTIPFELAAAMGEGDLVELMIDKGARITGTNSLGKPALMVALRNGRTRVAELLQERGVPLTLSDLAHLGLKKEIQRSLENGANVNERGDGGSTALMSAAGQGNLELVQWLLDKGADLSSQGLSALSRAALNGRLEVVKFFLQEGVEVSGKGSGLDLVGVVRNRHMKVLELLVANGADVNARDYGGRTPLMQAADSGRTHMARLLLHYGADVNVSTKLGETAMSYALREMDGHYGVSKKVRHIDIAALLWEQGVPLPGGLEDIGGSEELFSAISSQSVEAVRMLLELGADTNVRGYNHADTPLISAAREGNPQIARLLLGGGAEVNASNARGDTSLMCATAIGNLEMVRLLLAHGADAGKKNSAGKTAHDEAYGRHGEEIRKLLKAHMPKSKPAN